MENKRYSKYDHDHYSDGEYECTSVAASKFCEWVHLSIDFHIPLKVLDKASFNSMVFIILWSLFLGVC